MKKNVFLWGVLYQSRVLQEIVEDQGYQITHLFDSNPKAKPLINNIPLIGDWKAFEKWKRHHSPKEYQFVIAVGSDGIERYILQQKLIKAGYQPLTLIHKTAYVSKTATLGKGVQVLGKAFVGSYVTLYDACLINTGAQVDHDSTIGIGAHLMPGAIVTGRVTVHNFVTIGSGATILPLMNVDEHSIIGAGAVVTKNVPRRSLFAGIPAKKIKTL